MRHWGGSFSWTSTTHPEHPLLPARHKHSHITPWSVGLPARTLWVNIEDFWYNVSAMADTLPQQQLLLELLIMSGKIGVPADDTDTILWRTLGECKKAGWIIWVEVSPGLFSIEITGKGRRAAAS